MSKKIEMRCQNCGYFLFNKVLPLKPTDKEYGGVEVPCPNCNHMNVFGVKDKTDKQPYGERFTYQKKSA